MNKQEYKLICDLDRKIEKAKKQVYLVVKNCYGKGKELQGEFGENIIKSTYFYVKYLEELKYYYLNGKFIDKNTSLKNLLNAIDEYERGESFLP